MQTLFRQRIKQPDKEIVREIEESRRGFFVAVDANCNVERIECQGGVTEGDYWLLVLNSAHNYGVALLGREVARQEAERGG